MRVVVIGVGNPYRSDDGAGPETARLVGERLPAVEVVELDGEPSGLLEAWNGADLAFVVDAVHSHAAAPGGVHRIELGAGGVARPSRSPTSHGLGPGDAVALGQVLDRLPHQLVLYGIEGESFAAGLGLSPAVRAAVTVVAEHIEGEVRAACASARPRG